MLDFDSSCECSNHSQATKTTKYKRVAKMEDQYIGKKYGGYEVISKSDRLTNDKHAIYNCRCIHCGTEKQMPISHIKYKKNDKCSHYITIGEIKIPYNSENNSIPNIRLRKIFLKMLYRCYDSNYKDYRFYGERGIRVCDEWITNPSSFYQWAITHGYNNKQTIDRINEQKGYYPENCRWVTLSENVRFKGNTNYITATVTLSGKQWSRLIPEHGVNYINEMFRREGEEKTIEYIEKRFENKHKIANT